MLERVPQTMADLDLRMNVSVPRFLVSLSVINSGLPMSIALPEFVVLKLDVGSLDFINRSESLGSCQDGRLHHVSLEFLLYSALVVGETGLLLVLVVITDFECWARSVDTFHLFLIHNIDWAGQFVALGSSDHA